MGRGEGTLHRAGALWRNVSSVSPPAGDLLWAGRDERAALQSPQSPATQVSVRHQTKLTGNINIQINYLFLILIFIFPGEKKCSIHFRKLVQNTGDTFSAIEIIMKTRINAQGCLLLMLLSLLNIRTIQSINRNIGIEFTSVPESRVAPPGDWVFFNCKTNLGKGKVNISEERRHTDY